jgi:hypothetical protein
MITDQDLALFCSGFQDGNKKYYFLTVHNYISLQRQQVTTSYKTIEGFLKLFVIDKRFSRSVEIITDPDPGGQKTYGTSDLPVRNTVITY